MDEEPPFNLALNVYKGPASIPHASAEVFGAFFLATNVSRCSALAWICGSAIPTGDIMHPNNNWALAACLS